MHAVTWFLAANQLQDELFHKNLLSNFILI